MDLSNLKPAKGSTKEKKRLGRGQGSGGQMPLQRLVPKFGFKNMNRIEYTPVNLATLQKLADKGITVITPEVLVENGVTHKKELVKILGRGELTAKVEVRAHAFSAKAKEMIEAVGGTCDKYETK